jgi:hypothetical protein
MKPLIPHNGPPPKGPEADRLLGALIKARAERGREELAACADASEAFFFTRLRARINERRGQLDGAEGCLWENAVVAARGWLLAFAFVAALLFAPGVASLLSPPPAQPVAQGLEEVALAPQEAGESAAFAAVENWPLDAGAPPPKETANDRK